MENKTSMLPVESRERPNPAILAMPPEFDRSYAICQLLPVADLAKCLFTLCSALDGWNDWNNWNSGTLGTRVRLKRFERSKAIERLERLNGLIPVMNEAKRLNGWND
jgi:hypothetical protein